MCSHGERYARGFAGIHKPIEGGGMRSYLPCPLVGAAFGAIAI